MDILQNEFLRSTAEETKNKYSHVTYFPKKSWSVSNGKKKDFWLNYCKLVFNNKEGERIFCIGEKQDSEGVPLFADFSFRFYNNTGDEDWQPIEATFIREIVRKYQKAIEELLDVKENNGGIEFICSVLQSPTYIIETEVKKMSGEIGREDITALDLRLQFPYCRIEPRYHNHIRNYVIKHLRTDNILSMLESQPVGDWPDLINTFNPSDTVTMYGSVNKEGIPYKEYQYSYRYLDDNIDYPIYAKDKEVYYLGDIPPWKDCFYLYDKDGDDMFPIQNHKDIHSGLFEITEEDEEDKEEGFWLPMIFSMHYWNQMTLPIEEAKHRSDTRPKYRSVNRVKINSENMFQPNRTENMDNIELCELFLSMISSDRYKKKNQWLEIGRALYTETYGQENGLELWKSYTKMAKDKMNKVPKFLKNKDLFIYMDTEYITFTDMKINIETLAWYAKKDSYEEYNKWHEEWYTDILKKCAEEEASDWKLALGFKRIYWLNIKCTNTSSKNFYFFRRNRWEFYPNDSLIDNMLSSEYINHFRRLRHEASDIILHTKDKSQRKENEMVIDSYTKIISILESSKRKASIIKSICNQLYDQNFKSKLDRNPDIIGFGNVVFDTGGEGIEVREGKPQDYVNQISPILYNHNMNDNHPLVKELEDWLHKAYPVDSLFRYFMKYAASILKGKNSDKIILIFLGAGNNSKSMIVKLFEALLGPYCVKVPVSSFTNKRKNGSSANPELARTAIARIVFLQEPDDDDTFKKGVLKEITGGDSYFVRFLHDNGGEIEVLHKTALICNQVPQVEGADDAIRERWHILPHLGKWIKVGAPKSLEEQMVKRLFECDPHFEERIKKLAPAMLYLMHKWYPIYKEEGLNPPKEMTQATNDYWDNTDIYHQFIADCIRPAEDERVKISISDMYDEFKDWYKCAFNKWCKIDRAKFKNEMSSKDRLNKPEGTYWKGLCFVDGGGNAADNARDIITKKKGKIGDDTIVKKTLKKSNIRVKDDSDDEKENIKENKNNNKKDDKKVKKKSSIRVRDDSDDESDSDHTKIKKKSSIRVKDDSDDESDTKTIKKHKLNISSSKKDKIINLDSPKSRSSSYKRMTIIDKININNKGIPVV